MRYRIYYASLLLLILIGCPAPSSVTAPSDFTISAPSDATATFSELNPMARPGTGICVALKFVVKDSKGPRNGIDVNFLSTYAGLYTDGNCSTLMTPDNFRTTVKTDNYGAATAYVGVVSTACSATADITNTVTVTGSLPITSATWKDAVTVKKCGT